MKLSWRASRRADASLKPLPLALLGKLMRRFAFVGVLLPSASAAPSELLAEGFGARPLIGLGVTILEVVDWRTTHGVNSWGLLSGDSSGAPETGGLSMLRLPSAPCSERAPSCRSRCRNMRDEGRRKPPDPALIMISDQLIRKDTALKVRRLNAVAAAGQEQSATFWFLVPNFGGARPGGGRAARPPGAPQVPMPFRLMRKLSTEKLTISVLPRDGQDLLACPISVSATAPLSEEPLSAHSRSHRWGALTPDCAPVAASKIILCVAYLTAALTPP